MTFLSSTKMSIGGGATSKVQYFTHPSPIAFSKTPVSGLIHSAQLSSPMSWQKHCRSDTTSPRPSCGKVVIPVPSPRSHAIKRSRVVLAAPNTLSRAYTAPPDAPGGPLVEPGRAPRGRTRPSPRLPSVPPVPSLPRPRPWSTMHPPPPSRARLPFPHRSTSVVSDPHPSNPPTVSQRGALRAKASGYCRC